MDLSVEFRQNKDIALAGMTGIYTNRLDQSVTPLVEITFAISDK